MSFSELCLLVIVAIVVIGPKDLPKVLRRAGQLAGKFRRMAADMRTQSGIDEVLREGSLNEDIAEIRKLAQGDFLAPIARPAPQSTPGGGSSLDIPVVREREYPRDGADSYGAIPDTAILYAHRSTPSALARDPLYVMGDANAVLPPPASTDAPQDAAPPEPADAPGAAR